MRMVDNQGSTYLSMNHSQISGFDPALEFGFLYCGNQFLSSYTNLINQYNPENLHQLRVSLRRLLSYLQFFKEEIPPNDWKDIHQIVKKLLKPTASVRDLYVINTNYILPAYRHNKHSDEFSSLMRLANNELLELHQTVLNEVSSRDYQLLVGELNDWINSRINHSDEKLSKFTKNSPAEKRIEKKLNKRYKYIMREIKQILKLDRKRLHKLRVNIKELRYVSEIFYQKNKSSKKRLKVLKKLQGLLGDINDSYVAERKLKSMNQYEAPRRYIKKQIKLQRKKCFQIIESRY